MVSEKINIFKTKLPKNVVLVAVSKTKPTEMILEACSKGHLDFGENKVQELVYKQEILPKNIRWHMIGHLQRNKVKYIAPFVYLIHGVDSLRLLNEIDKQGKKIDKKINCLLQIHISKEENKFGFEIQEINDFIKIIFTEMKIPFKMVKQTRQFKRDSEIMKICADTKKIRNNLKWKSNHSLKEIALKLLNKELY